MLYDRDAAYAIADTLNSDTALALLADLGLRDTGVSIEADERGVSTSSLYSDEDVWLAPLVGFL